MKHELIAGMNFKLAGQDYKIVSITPHEIYSDNVTMELEPVEAKGVEVVRERNGWVFGVQLGGNGRWCLKQRRTDRHTWLWLHGGYASREDAVAGLNSILCDVGEPV